MENKLFWEFMEDNSYFYKEYTLELGGDLYPLTLIINKGEEGHNITKTQYGTLDHFEESWKILQNEALQAMIKYYNEEQRFSWGPDDQEELEKWWPEIQTNKAMLHAIHPESIIIPSQYGLIEEGERRMYLLFSRSWGGEDLDDNGICICILNETIEEVGYKDIAF